MTPRQEFEVGKHYDELGSMDAITNGSGSVIQSMSFDAFGQRRLATSWDYGVSQNTLATMNDYTNRGYTDQEQLDNLSLVDMNGRVYDPTVGRFISADSTGGSGIGRYTYGMDSPLVYTDPSGFDDCPPTTDNDPAATCDAKLQPVTVTASPPDFGSGDITSGSGSGPGGPVQGSSGGVINLGDVDVNATATNSNTNNTINLEPVIDTAVRVPYVTTQSANQIVINFLFTPFSSNGSQAVASKPQSNPPQKQQCTASGGGSLSGSGNSGSNGSSPSNGPGYWDRYGNFVSQYGINVGPYAVGLLDGLWPKSWVPFTGGRPPLLGSDNPLTSVPRAFGVPGADSAVVRTGAAGIGLATVGIGFYDATIELEGFWYARSGQGSSSCSAQGK